MFDWVLPGWSAPGFVLAFVGLRVAVNALVTALVASAVGRRARRVAAITVWTAESALLQVLQLRPGGPGLRASYVELGGKLALFVLAGVTI